MKSILEKIQLVEKEASALIEKTEETGEKAIIQLTANEQKVIETTKAAAKKKADKIIAERTQKAQAELGSFKEEAKQAIEMTHSAAEKNRETTIKLVEKLFLNEFIKN